jgi:hypothetical protein
MGMVVGLIILSSRFICKVVWTRLLFIFFPFSMMCDSLGEELSDSL